MANHLVLGPQLFNLLSVLTSQWVIMNSLQARKPRLYRRLWILSVPLFFIWPLSFQFSFALSGKAAGCWTSQRPWKRTVVGNSGMVAGTLDVFCFLPRDFAIWEVSLKPGLCIDSQVQADPDSPSPSVLGKKCRTLGCLPRVQWIVTAH